MRQAVVGENRVVYERVGKELKDGKGKVLINNHTMVLIVIKVYV